MAYKKKAKVNDDDCFSHINKLAQQSIAETTAWESSQEKWYKLRMRIKKAKTTPFVGCSNIRMPTAETKIRKLKAALYNVVFGIRPVVQVTPSPSGNWQTARKIEKFIDHLVWNIMKLPMKAIHAIDQELEKGFFLIKPYFRLEITDRIEKISLNDLSVEEVTALYNPRTTPDMIRQFLMERLDPDTSDWVGTDNSEAIDAAVKEVLSGKEEIVVNLKDVLYNAPDVTLCPPERVFVPADSPSDPQRCEWVIHEFFSPWHEVMNMEKEDGWNKAAFEELKYWYEKVADGSAEKASRAETSAERQKALKEGISRLASASNQVRLWEFYGWYDINNDGRPEKCMITLAPDFHITLRKTTLPLYSGKFPLVKLCYEMTDDRWFAHRGIPELLEDIIKEIDVQHMQKIDNQTIRNAPMFVYRAGVVNPNLVKFMPGQGIPVNGMTGNINDNFGVLNAHNANVEFSYEREQMLLETKIEELIGQVDFTLQSMINKRQPRTLGEVQMQQQNMQQVFSLDSAMHTWAFSELFNYIWDLWCQYGEEEYEFAYFGDGQWEKIKLTREETQGQYKISVRGNDQNTNPQVRLQKAQMVLMAATNPVAIQSGVIKPHHLAEAYDLLFKELDVPDQQRLHEDPGVLFEMYKQSLNKPQPVDVRMNMKDLTDAEAAQVLARQGIQPDATGRALKSRAILDDKEAEHMASKTSSISQLADIVNSIGGGDDYGEEGSGAEG